MRSLRQTPLASAQLCTPLQTIGRLPAGWRSTTVIQSRKTGNGSRSPNLPPFPP